MCTLACLSVCALECVHVHTHGYRFCGYQKREILELAVTGFWASCLVLVLGTKPSSSIRTTHAFNCWTISPAPWLLNLDSEALLIICYLLMRFYCCDKIPKMNILKGGWMYSVHSFRGVSLGLSGTIGLCAVLRQSLRTQERVAAELLLPGARHSSRACSQAIFPAVFTSW